MAHFSPTKDLPVRENLILGVWFEKQRKDQPGTACGVLSVYHSDREAAGKGRIRTRPGKVGVGGKGLDASRDGGEPVTER